MVKSLVKPENVENIQNVRRVYARGTSTFTTPRVRSSKRRSFDVTRLVVLSVHHAQKVHKVQKVIKRSLDYVTVIILL